MSKLIVEVVIKVGVQPLFWVGGGGWWSDEMELVLISTQFVVVVEVGLEKVPTINFHGWVAGSIGNKTISAFNLIEVEAELGKNTLGLSWLKLKVS